MTMIAALLCAFTAGLIGFGWLDWQHPFGWLAAAVFFQSLSGFVPVAAARWASRSDGR